MLATQKSVVKGLQSDLKTRVNHSAVPKGG